VTSKIKIDINSTKTAFNVVAPFFANELVRELPNRTFDTRAKVWRCSMVRFNAKHIKEHWYSIKEIEWGAGVKEAVERLSSDEPLKREPFPANFRFKTHPFKHQKDALDYLWSLKAAALFSEQGTGKTKVAIDLATARYMLGEIDALVVISPTSVRYEWAKKELPAHFNGMFRTFVLDTSTSGYERRFSDFCTMSPGMPVLLVGYDALSNTASKVGRLVESYLKDRRCMLVLDESHNIKNPAANRTERITDMGEHATYRLVMTGTPSSGSTLDLYAQYQFLDRQIIGIGNYTSFKARYVVMGGYENKQVVGYKNTDELMELVKPYTFQVTKEEALPHLPPKVYQTRYLEMGDKQKKMYQDMRRKRKLEIDKALKSGEPLELVAESVLQTYNMLCQMTDGFVYHETEEPDGVGGVRKIKQTER
jgi:SNF2 family DNA or RNA helicase